MYRVTVEAVDRPVSVNLTQVENVRETDYLEQTHHAITHLIRRGESRTYEVNDEDYFNVNQLPEGIEDFSQPGDQAANQTLVNTIN